MTPVMPAAAPTLRQLHARIAPRTALLEDKVKEQFTIKGPEGQTHNVQGDPQMLTLRDLFGEVGKTGGVRDSGKVRFKVSGKEYKEQDFDRTLSELGIQPNTPIEIVSS
jgi:hypothetical protein